MKTRFLVFTAAMLVGAASTTHAQNVVADSTVDPRGVDSAAVAHVAIVSVIDATPAAVHRTAEPRSLDAARAATHQGLGQAKALMFVGAAGFVAGALIGGDSGKIIMVGSAVVGLCGLYQYLQ